MDPKGTTRAVTIVGAGPAGATAARSLALAGVPVQLLDRADFPRNKPCGGAISIRVLRRFAYLKSALARIATHTVARLQLEGPEGGSTLIESDAPAALLIRRFEFDALLVKLAVEAGAELVPGVDVVQAREEQDRVVLTARDGRRFDAPVVVAADGVNSVVARRLGLSSGWPAASVAIDMMEETTREHLRDVDPSTMWVSYGYEPDIAECGSRNADSPNAESFENRQSIRNPQSATRNGPASEGYAYIFPKRDHVNIGIGYVLSHYRRDIDAAPYELQRGLISRLKARGIVAGSSVRKNFMPFLIPVGGPLRKPGRGRVLLAGDAGGFVNGFTAEGIYYAMVSGELAAQAIVETRGDRRVMARRYRRACDHEIGVELRDSAQLQRHLFTDRRRIARIIGGAARETGLTQLILDYAIGRRSYRDVRRRLIARSPLFATRLVWENLTRKTLSSAAILTTI